jgi:hypothetical protein
MTIEYLKLMGCCLGGIAINDTRFITYTES